MNTAQNSSDNLLIIFPLILQTIINLTIAQILLTGGEESKLGDVGYRTMSPTFAALVYRRYNVIQIGLKHLN